ncbi:MAG: hypothetical protein VX204_02035 [Candidatus Thermoplasmatota archaeon]|nr:hypothetical protein [Candidatus Thermoplasmatota archaeon]
MEGERVPSSGEPVEERLLFLQENMVSFVNQFSMPVIEVSLVLSKYIRIILDSLLEAAEKERESLPQNLLEAWPIESNPDAPAIDSYPLDKLLSSLDEDRMDILDTLIRSIVNESQLPFVPVLTLLREWESIAKAQLSQAGSPGHLFSPMEFPEGF